MDYIAEKLLEIIKKDKQLSDKLRIEFEKEQTEEERQDAIMHLLYGSPECLYVVFIWLLFNGSINER